MRVVWTHIAIHLGMGWILQPSAPGPGAGGGALLLESGDYLLLEDGSKLLLE